MSQHLFKVTKTLDKWLNARKEDHFPMSSSNGKSYKKLYASIEDNLKPIHNSVEKGALLEDAKKLAEENNLDPEQLIYLNNHGVGHVNTVIAKASDLLIDSECKISPYEGYLLLCAIQFHDVGNIFGRENHEKKCQKILKDFFPNAGYDSPEEKVIVKIATVHGGCYKNSKDTISSLHLNSDLMGQNIRKRFLAATLRLADELSDDRSRAERYLLRKGEITKASELHHTYSDSLHSVIVENNEIRLAYEFSEKIAKKDFKKLIKNNGTLKWEKQLLLDEIYERSLKMHKELLYCMRFMRPFISIDRILVNIAIYSEYDYVEPIEKITYVLEEKGYPSDPPAGICSICPELKGLSGKDIKKKLLTKQR